MELPVSAILLAAGSSARMGRTKQLLPLGDKSVVRRCIDSLRVAGISEVTVVVGACRSELTAHLEGLAVTIAVNDTPGSDMAESLRAGLKRLHRSSPAILVCLSDHPLVSSETIASIIRAHHRFPGNIIIPTYNSRRGHPVLFPRTILDEIFSSMTLRDIVWRHPARVRLVPVQDEGVVLDMDTPEDYATVLRRYAAK